MALHERYDMKKKEEQQIVIHAKSTKDVDDFVYFLCTYKLRDSAG